MTTRDVTYGYRTATHRYAAAFMALAAMVLACVLCLVAASDPATAQAATKTTAQIKVEQKYTSDVTGAHSMFQYRLEAETKGAPMPRGTTNGVYTWSMKGSVKKTVDIELAGIERNVPFVYKMYQVTPTTDTDGYTFDSTVYYPEVTLLGNGVPRYIVRFDDGTKPSKILWTVDYDSTSIGEDDTPTNPGEGDDDDPSIDDGDTPTDPGTGDDDDPSIDEDDDDGDDSGDDEVAIDNNDTPTSPVRTGDVLMWGACGLLVVSLAGAALALRRRDREE